VRRVCAELRARPFAIRVEDAVLGILLVNGWPSTFLEELPLVPLLTDPGLTGSRARRSTS
jgi:hypothetical protein